MFCPAHIIADTELFQCLSDAGGADIAKFQTTEQADEPFCAEVEPLGSVLANQSDRPVDLVKRCPVGSIAADGIVQDKGMEAFGCIGQCDRFALTGRQVDVSAIVSVFIVFSPLHSGKGSLSTLHNLLHMDAHHLW